MELMRKLFLPITVPMKFIQDHFKAMLFVLLLVLLFAPASNEDFTANNLQTIKLSGPIMEVSEVLSKINKAYKNDNIKGVLLVVDSPGGAVAPSVEIAYALKRLKTKKSVVVYAAGTLASGSYYASIWADKIIANPGSMVGSIGVIIQSADLSELLAKIGIKSQSVQAGKYKKVGTPDREWTDYEVNELNKVIHATYDMFTKDVADARGLDYTKRDLYANAHIFTAHQAKEVGLVDSIGVMYDAKKELEYLSQVALPVWNKEDKFDKFMKKLSATTSIALYTYFPSLVLK
ncbi:MAG: signal peptide peptidase SppA [Sulfurimonas sp.]|nr:signal peptide peptidase SppA [Sulfurimonas sp.]MDQ7061534.1 signal peptide peptidase SppA [Sulfurimonas sp.]